MIYALDTNIISYVLNGNDAISAELSNTLKAGNKVVIPLVVYYEARRGLVASGAEVKTRAFNKLCERLGIYHLTVADMNTAAGIYADNKHRGTTIDDADLLIAAQCITGGYTLVTHNTKHFDNIKDLSVVDWVKE